MTNSKIHLDAVDSTVHIKNFLLEQVHVSYDKDLLNLNIAFAVFSFCLFVCLFFPFVCRLHNHNPPTYETGSTRKFLLGRTDTIRSASIASSEFVKAMVSPNKTVSYLFATLDI